MNIVVVSNKNKLVFVDDENKMNIACTKTQEILIFIVIREIMKLIKNVYNKIINAKLVSNKFTKKNRRFTENVDIR